MYLLHHYDFVEPVRSVHVYVIVSIKLNPGPLSKRKQLVYLALRLAAVKTNAVRKALQSD